MQYQFVLPTFRQQCVLLLVCMLFGKLLCQPAYAESFLSPSEKDPPYEIDECKNLGIYLIKEKTIYATRGIGQEFHIPDSNTVLIGEKGTHFNEAKLRKSTIIMKTGKIFAMTGKKEYFDLITHFGEIRMAGDCHAVVQYTEDGVLRMRNLMGSLMVLTFRVGHHPYAITAGNGQEICIVENDTYDREKLVPLDGVEREKMWSEYVPGCLVDTNRFDQKAMVEREALLTCTSDNSPETIKRIESLKKHARPLPRSKDMTSEPAVGVQLALAPRRVRTI